MSSCAGQQQGAAHRTRLHQTAPPQPLHPHTSLPPTNFRVWPENFPRPVGNSRTGPILILNPRRKKDRDEGLGPPLRERERERGVPVLALTGTTERGTGKSQLAAGADFLGLKDTFLLKLTAN